MSVSLGHWVNLTPSIVTPCSDPFSSKSTTVIATQSRLSSAATDISLFRLRSVLPSSCSKRSLNIRVSSAAKPSLSSDIWLFRLRSVLPSSCSKRSLTIRVSSAAKPSLSSGGILASSLSGGPSQEDSSGDDVASEDATEKVEEIEKVVVHTTRNSRTVRAFSDEPEYISERYVKGSLTYQIELSRSFRLEQTAAEVAEVQGTVQEGPSGTEGVSTLGDDGVWRSLSYLKQGLRKTQKYREVIFKYPTESAPVDDLTPKDESIQGSDDRTDTRELQPETASDEQLYEGDLRRSLNIRRHIATEIFEGSLSAAELSPTFTKELISFMPQFIDRIITEAVALKKVPKNKELSFNSRARLYITNSKVVELVRWLKHQKLTAPRMGRLISKADESMGKIRSRIEWLKAVYVKGRDLGVILERYPQILELPLDNLNNTVEVLENAGVQRKWLGQVVSRHPIVLTLSSDELLAKIAMFAEMGISKEQFGVMVFRFPGIVGRFSVEEMRSKVDFLRQIGLDDAVFVKIIASTPQLLGCSIEVWSRLLRYFYFCRIELSGVRRILGVTPAVFCLNLEENIAPKVRFLRAIGVHEEAVGQLIVDFPAILTYSLDKKIRPVIRFLLEEAGVRDEKVGKVITLQPELIRCSLPNKLQVLVKYLLSRGIRADQLGEMVADFPALLMYSVPVLHPKFQYLVQVMMRPVDDIVNFPRYFSYSLKSRIIPRHELLQEKGLTFSLRHMLACSDDVFNTKLEAPEQVDIEKSDDERQPDPVEDL